MLVALSEFRRASANSRFQQRIAACARAPGAPRMTRCPENLLPPYAAARLTAMAEMLECLVNYFSGDTNEEGLPRLYVCYQIISGPGTTSGGGLAAITLLFANHSGIWESSQR